MNQNNFIVKQELSHVNEQELPSFRKNAKHTRGYTHVNSEKKRALIEEVIQKGRRIKDAAEDMGLNYSNAKHIVKKY